MPKGGPIWLERDSGWAQVRSPDPEMKGAHRNGGFRDAFNNRTQLVVGTQGSPEETRWAWAKARFDAEYLWYQGNASLDVVPDTAFDPAAEPDPVQRSDRMPGLHLHEREGATRAGLRAHLLQERGPRAHRQALLALRSQPVTRGATPTPMSGSAISTPIPCAPC